MTLKVAFAIFLLMIITLLELNNASKNRTLYMLALYSQPLCRASMQIVIDRVNENPYILPDFRLDAAFGYDQCMDVIALLEFMRMVRLSNRPPSPILLGPSCATVCQRIGAIAPLFNMIEVAAGCQNADIPPSQLYDTFYSVDPSLKAITEARLWLLKKMGWDHVALITGAEELSRTDSNVFIQSARNQGVTIASNELLSDSLSIERTVKKLVTANSSIIFVNCSPVYLCSQFFCAAFKNGLYGKKVVFILNNWAALGLLPIYGCKMNDLETTLDGAILVGPPLAHFDHNCIITTLNYTGAQFDADLLRQIKVKPSDEIIWAQRAQCHDAALFGAFIIHETELLLRKANRSLVDLSDYNDPSTVPFLMEAVRRVEVTGLRGLLKVNSKEMSTPVEISQKRNGTLVRAYLFHSGHKAETEQFASLTTGLTSTAKSTASTHGCAIRMLISTLFFSLIQNF